MSDIEMKNYIMFVEKSKVSVSMVKRESRRRGSFFVGIVIIKQ